MSKTKVPASKKLPEKQSPTDYSFLRNLAWLCLIIFGTWFVYSSSLNFELTNWDEKHYIYEQSMTRSFNWENIKEMFSKKVLGSYNPLVLMSFAIDNELSSGKASWYHGVNLFFHILNAALLFAVVRMLGFRSMIAGFVALLFAIHPMHVESVAWVASRKDVLMGFFLFSSWCFYLFFKNKNNWLMYFAGILFFLLALLSKAQAVTFPFILILSDYLINKSWNWKALYNKIPFFILS
ncbi:MAG: hypothetical protein KA444_00340, partial [Bacteroidia bacterium]|nr:hypothetical protein [Bacteroidia bacterium]